MPVEVLCQVPLITHKETIREVPQKETVQTEKLVELHTTEEVIKHVEVIKEIHHDTVQEVASIIEVERPKNAILMRELIAQVCASVCLSVCCLSVGVLVRMCAFERACVRVCVRRCVVVCACFRMSVLARAPVFILAKSYGRGSSERQCLVHRLRI